MAAHGVENTPSTAILWAVYTDLHGFATRGADLESGQFTEHEKKRELIVEHFPAQSL